MDSNLLPFASLPGSANWMLQTTRHHNPPPHKNEQVSFRSANSVLQSLPSAPPPHTHTRRVAQITDKIHDVNPTLHGTQLYVSTDKVNLYILYFDRRLEFWQILVPCLFFFSYFQMFRKLSRICWQVNIVLLWMPSQNGVRPKGSCIFTFFIQKDVFMHTVSLAFLAALIIKF